MNILEKIKRKRALRDLEGSSEYEIVRDLVTRALEKLKIARARYSEASDARSEEHIRLNAAYPNQESSPESLSAGREDSKLVVEIAKADAYYLRSVKRHDGGLVVYIRAYVSTLKKAADTHSRYHKICRSDIPTTYDRIDQLKNAQDCIVSRAEDYYEAVKQLEAAQLSLLDIQQVNIKSVAAARAEEANRVAAARAEESNRIATARAEEANRVATARAEEANRVAAARAVIPSVRESVLGPRGQNDRIVAEEQKRADLDLFRRKQAEAREADRRAEQARVLAEEERANAARVEAKRIQILAETSKRAEEERTRLTLEALQRAEEERSQAASIERQKEEARERDRQHERLRLAANARRKEQEEAKRVREAEEVSRKAAEEQRLAADKIRAEKELRRLSWEACVDLYDADFVNTMTGTEYERFISDLLRRRGIIARLTGGAGDRGADLLFEHKGKRIVIQAKRQKDKVGTHAVMQAHWAKGNRGADSAWVVTSSAFHKRTEQAAAEVGVILISGDPAVFLDSLL